ncbi:MAG: rhomboid family intramembrane serine protease, partial [Flavobacteriales bacterium]|nr:rhomboid family intramembrane serine protease [Flavobacteriales bacterium]
FSYLPSYGNLISSGITADEISQMLTNNEVIKGVTQAQFADLKNIFPIFNASMVGASGCIMGILVAFGMMNPNAELMLIFLPIPIKAKYFIPGIILLDLISGITGQSFFSPSNTAYMAHVGGALTGFIIMWYWKKNQFNKNRWY